MIEPLKVGDRVRVISYAAKYWPAEGVIYSIDLYSPLKVRVEFTDRTGCWFAPHELVKV